MRIAVFTDNFYPELGGIQDSAETIVRELGRRGHEVKVFAPRYGAHDFSMRGLSQREIDLGPNVSIVRCMALPYKSSTLQSRATIFTGLRWLQLRTWKPDVIHAQTPYVIGMEALIASRILRVPLVGTNHTAIKSFSEYIPMPIEWFVNFMVWYFNRCALVSAPSQSVFNELGVERHHTPTIVVSNPIDTKLFCPDPQVLRDSHLIVYAGRLAREKKIQIILEALQKLPDVRLELAGHGSYEPTLRAYAEKYGVTQRVTFLGTQTHEQLAHLFNKASLFVNMSTSETQSMVTQQALACGLPVVCAHTRGLSEYVNESVGAFVPENDAAALARTVSSLLAAPDRLTQMRDNARIHAQQFSTEKIAESWETVYKKVIS